MDTGTHNTKFIGRRWLALAAALLLCVSLPMTSQAAERKHLPRFAQPDFNTSKKGNSFAPAPGISIEKATAIARKHTGGRVLSATPRHRSNGTEYRIRMLVDGERVVTVVVDSTGRIRKRKG